MQTKSKFTGERSDVVQTNSVPDGQATSRGATPRPRSNADIRPFVSIGEAAGLALSAIAARMEKPE